MDYCILQQFTVHTFMYISYIIIVTCIINIMAVEIRNSYS